MTDVSGTPGRPNTDVFVHMSLKIFSSDSESCVFALQPGVKRLFLILKAFFFTFDFQSLHVYKEILYSI